MRDLGVHRRIILKRILKIYDVRIWAGFNWLSIWFIGRLLRIW